jgi:hypothetical protein
MLFAAIMIVVGVTNRGWGQTSATVTGTTAGAQLIVPMTIAQDAVLHFGTINLLVGAAGTVLLPSSSTTRTPNGGVALSTVSPTATNAAYHVTGTMHETYSLTLPASITVTETTANTAVMTINNIKARFNGAGADATTSTLSATGTDNFTVGGTLNITAGQMAGIYAGTFDVSVDYN